MNIIYLLKVLKIKEIGSLANRIHFVILTSKFILGILYTYSTVCHIIGKHGKCSTKILLFGGWLCNMKIHFPNPYVKGIFNDDN